MNTASTRRVKVAPRRRRFGLSKSRFVAGCQCHKRLWWQVHEPGAAELRPDPALRALFAQGHRVGERARQHVPGGTLIDFSPRRIRQALQATREAIAGGEHVIYEAAFEADGVLVVVDILERVPEGEGSDAGRRSAGRRSAWRLIEVKGSTGVKRAHLDDLAIQHHVVSRCGLCVERAELMHLNRECRYPELEQLFVRADVTEAVRAREPRVASELRAQRAMLGGALPMVAAGPHCRDPHDCPFVDRCRDVLPAHHLSELYGVWGTRLEQLLAEGYRTIDELPEGRLPAGIAARQHTAVTGKRVVVEAKLGAVLARLERPFAYLDFETIFPAIPVFDGCRPYDQVPVQLSVHREGPGARLKHHEWLACGSDDPREECAQRLLEATADAATVFAWHAPFELQRIAELAQAVPRFRNELEALAARTVDLLSIVRDHVYHPGFRGGFGLKQVVSALIPELAYDDLAVRSGADALWLLEDLLLRGTPPAGGRRDELRDQLLRYCERDTLVLVEIMRWLERHGVG
jgi:predicted RecB family nuclease